MKNQRGSAAVWIIVILVIVIVAGAAYWYWSQNSAQPAVSATTETLTQQNTTPTTPSTQDSNPISTSNSTSNTATSFHPIASGTAPAVAPQSNDFSRIKSDYFSDGTTIFFVEHGAVTVMPEADISSFLVLNTVTDANPWGLDKNHVYYLGQIINGADAATFKLLDGFGYAEDNHAVYWQNEVIPSADLATFVAGDPSNGAEYGAARDKNHIYCFGTAYPLDSAQCTPPPASATSVPQQISVPGMSEYTDSSFGFSFWYPSAWTVSELPITQSYLPNLADATVVQRLQIAGGSGQDNAELDVVQFPTTSITVPTAGCTGTYFYSAANNEWMQTSSGGDGCAGTTPYTQTPNTMGGLPTLFTQAGIGAVQYIVPLNSTSLQTSVVVGSSGMYSILIPTADTITATNPSAATPESVVQQKAAIQAEQSAYASQ